MENNWPIDPSGKPLGARTLAVVSGKGGSGKTLVATALAEGLAISGHQVLLVDADLGTGGLSYYLGFSAYSRARDGLSEFILRASSAANSENSRSTDPLPAVARRETIEHAPIFKRIDLMPVGEHRLLYKKPESLNESIISELIRKVSQSYRFVIFDCRGGIDQESLAVCAAVQDIMVVVETDAASIQASQHLINVLSEAGYAGKLAGFILNKVMDDPSSLAKAGISFFRSEYLGAVPFDIEATRSFIKGDVPSANTMFASHVFRITTKLFPKYTQGLDRYPVLRSEEFSTVTLKGPDYRYGTLLVGLYMALIAMPLSFLALVPAVSSPGTIYYETVLFLGACFALLAFASLSDSFRQRVGIFVRRLGRVFSRPRDRSL